MNLSTTLFMHFPGALAVANAVVYILVNIEHIGKRA